MSDLDADLHACAAIVERGDPLRFRTVMAAPLAARRVLFPLYAFNIEVSRAPWVTAEPMIAEMRLQWWRDALAEIAAGDVVRRHEVVTPLSTLLSAEAARALEGLIEARRWDIYREPFADDPALEDYLNQTSGSLMWTGAAALGQTDETAVRAIGFASGVVAFLRAVPALEAAGRIPLVDGSQAGVRALCERALECFGQGPRRAGPALWPAIGTQAVLRRVIQSPAVVAAGEVPEGITSWRLMRAAVQRKL